MSDPFAADHVHRLASSIRNDIDELQALLNTDSHHLVEDEESNLREGLGGLQGLLAGIARPALRVVR